MREKKLYICEKCGKEFERYIECENHEFKCLDKRVKYEGNIKNVIDKAKSEFGSFIIESEYEIDDEFVYEGDYINCYHFGITFKLSNGNTVQIYDGMDEYLHLGNYLEEEVIWDSTEREIKKCIPTSFEGVIYWQSDDGWRNDYIGDLLISDIVDRLNGRKVKLEVID